jgi:hypothetical protein
MLGTLAKHCNDRSISFWHKNVRSGSGSAVKQEISKHCRFLEAKKGDVSRLFRMDAKQQKSEAK